MGDCKEVNIPTVNDDSVDCDHIHSTDCIVTSESVPCLQTGAGATLTELLNRLCSNLNNVSEPDCNCCNVEQRTYNTLMSEVGFGTVQANCLYHITDRDIWLRAISSNELSVQGIRLMRVPDAKYYTPTVDTGFEYVGIYGQGRDEDTVPASDGTTTYYAVWGGKVWERTIASTDNGIVNQGELSPISWTELPRSGDEYVSKTFYVDYDLENDSVELQKDWKGNEIRNLTVDGFSTIELTDWNLERVEDNICFGVFNNYNKQDFMQIRRNTNYGYIGYNRFDRAIATIDLNSNIGNIYSNNIGGSSIAENSNKGSIENNSNSINILKNSNANDINDNSNKGDILLNQGIGVIEGNSNGATHPAGGNIENNICGNIQNNSNDGKIKDNRNSLHIQDNTSDEGTLFQIVSNRNNGRIIKNNSTANIDIINNINNGNIGLISSVTNRAANITDPTVNK